MSVAAGTRLGPYEIVVRIGVGGMGEVWRASDASLGRSVAIKVLPEAFAQDPERLARFEREARTLARLNHPNIATIHGFEQAPPTPSGQPGIRALVMELVEGPTLADRLAAGAISPDEALQIARQIAQALEAAHELGIIHRDLKPANIKVRPDGTVKVLDFGLAKALDPVGDTASAGALPATITSPAMMTAAGVLLGTAAYMSPEQARGRPVDKRTDIWAFGAVLYEMLTGRRAFPGDDVAEAVASVVAREPDWTLLPPGLPGVRACLVRCLQKDRRQRMRDIGDVLLALDGAFDAAPVGAAPRAAPAPPLSRRVIPAVVAALVTAIAIGLAAWKLWPIADVRPVTRFEYVLPHDQQLATTQRPVIAVSRDGRYFVYQATDGLYLRAMDALEARRIPGTEARAVGIPDLLYNTFVSPDGRWIGFFAGGALKKIAVEGGAPVALCPVTPPYGASWAADNTIVFGQLAGIMRVSANGGTPELIVKAAEGEEIYGPQVLPGGDALLFSVTTDRGPARWERARIVVQSLSSGKRTVVVEGGSDARYLPTGHLVYAVRDTIFGVSFDATRLTTRGGAVPLVPGVQRSVGVVAVASNYGVSDRGTLVYLVAKDEPRSFVWLHRKDGRVERVAAIPPGAYEDPRLSRDDRLLLTTRDGDIWIYELASGRSHRLTHDGSNLMGVWDPTGSRVAYSSARGGNLEAWVVPSDGSGQARQLTQLGGQVHVDSWSPDGRLLAMHHHRGSEPVAMLVLPMDRPDAKPQVFVKGDFGAEGADFSRDGRHAAYLSQESGQREIYIRQYPGPGGQQIVSVGGGREPAWAPNGDVFYRSLEGGRMFAVAVKTAPTLQIGTSVPLFEGRYYIAPSGSPRRQYDVTADGQRILMLTPGNVGSGPTVVVVQNWFQELERAVSSAVQR